MDPNTKIKIIIGTLTMLAWLCMVLLGKTEAQPFIDALRQVLEFIGVYHVVKSNS